MTARRLSASITQEDDWFVARSLEVDIASQGETEDEALNNLREAIALHREPTVDGGERTSATTGDA